MMKCIDWYNTKRIHQALDYLTPDRVYLHPESAKHFQPETVRET
jgi:transposase InsO family protein